MPQQQKTYVYFDNDPAPLLDRIISDINPNGLFVLADTNTAQYVLPRLSGSKCLQTACTIVVPCGEINKSMESLGNVWKALAHHDANRHSLLVCVGGGMVTDLGGFAAATFKRGIQYINVPTTLLGAVDASVGGKTGINYGGLKNEVGAFHSPAAVVVTASLLATLHAEEMLSGWAEMLKHALLSDPAMVASLISSHPTSCSDPHLLRLMQDSMQVKQQIVAKDPFEGGERRALNFGHTAGHAFESLSIKRKSPVPHGYAVAFGMVVELILSNFALGFPSAEMNNVVRYIKDNYGTFEITCHNYEQLLDYMRHDKKNNGEGINFTLLRQIGDPVIDNHFPDNEICAALDIYRDMML